MKTWINTSARFVNTTAHDWIQSSVSNKSFLDVGGLWNRVNEKVSLAQNCGASSVSMLDRAEPSHPLWKNFAEQLNERGATCDNAYAINLLTPDITKIVPTHDIVHCNGVLYHVSDPYLAIKQLYSLTNDLLIFGSTRIPHDGLDPRLDMYVPNGAMLPTCSLSPENRKKFAEFYGNVNAVYSHGIDQDCYSVSDGNFQHPEGQAPWFWFMTDGYIEYLLKANGFNILAKKPYGYIDESYRNVYYLASKIQRD